MAGPDDELQDAELLGEVELTASLMVAANESEQPLTQDAIDRILGVAPATERLRDRVEPA